ncbi:uncharacterized protein LOC118735860 isoform X2 [Rhagoletis pomonella]|nr:uncharacterized protein LOC118735860 isoform X2 [Rhagoletis pomonella]
MSSSAANSHHQQQQHSSAKHHNSCGGGGSGNPPPVFFLVASNGNSNGNIVNGSKHSSNASPAPTGVGTPPNAISAVSGGPLGHFAAVEGRKPKLRRFNSHDTSANMFSVADFENARLARRNEIEMKQRLARRMRMSATGGYGCAAGGMGASLIGGSGCGLGASGNGMGVGTGGGNSMCGGGDYSTGDSKASKYSNESQHEPLPADIFLDRYSLPRVVRISYKTKFSDETLQSSSSNGSSTATTNTTGTSASVSNSSVSACGLTVAINTGTSSSTASSSGNVNAHSSGATNTSSSGGGGGGGGGGGSGGSADRVGSKQHSTPHNTTPPATTTQSNTTINGNSNTDVENREDHGELFLLYRLIRQRHIFHGHNAKTAAASRKKGVLIPQEFPGYFSLLNDKGTATATLYTSLIQLVRERVYKFVSVDNMPAFTESQPNVNNPPAESCLPMYTQPPPPPTNNRPQYVKTTARGGQVFRLLAVFEDGKQDHSNTIGCTGSVTAKSNNNHGREKEKGRYAQLLNENRQVLYVSLSTKGKFYEIEPGIPQILQKLGGIGNEANKKANPDCVHRITALITPQRELPLTLRYISGPHGCNSAIPENVCITHITTENVVIACPIEDVEVQSPLHLRKLHLSKEMNLLKSSLGFESEQRMLANPNVQNILKFCQFNCDQFLKMVEVEILHRPERSGSKSRGEGLKILKPLHLPKLLRREKTTIPAHEKEDSIIFLSKSDLANLEAKEAAAQAAFESAASSANRITEKMKVFQSTKKKWFRKQDKHAAHTLTSYELDVQAKRMSMERYSDMSKLLQERFGDKPNAQTHDAHESVSEPSGGASDIGCSDTETTTLATIDEKLRKVETSGNKMITKSMSLQDIELISGGAAARKPDLLPNDTISEAGTDLEDLDNQDLIPQSFITEKLYNEFHVKTRQYSKSSSSLHQLLNFSLPQKMQLHDNKRSMAQLKHNGSSSVAGKPAAVADRRLDFNIGEPVTGRRAAGGLSLLAGNAGVANSLGILGHHSALASPLTPTSLIDDLPYSSVRDSLVLSSDESASDNPTGNICQALNMIDYNKENIYAEICHDNISHHAAGITSVSAAATAGTTVSAMGGICSSTTRDTFSGDTHSTQISDDYGDYASLTYTAIERTAQPNSIQTSGSALSKSTSGQTVVNASAPTALAISRVQVNCNSVSPVSYHTVYLGDEPLGNEKQRERGKRHSKAGSSKSREHVTTVALEGNTPTAYEPHNASGNIGATAASIANELEEVADNIYNTLK